MIQEVTKTHTAIHVSVGEVVVSARGLDKITPDPEVRITNQKDRARLGGISVVAIDRTRLDEIIAALQGLQAELAAFPQTVKDYVEERDLGGDHWREGREQL